MKSLSQPAALAQIVERLRALEVSDHRRWGLMTAGQMLCHVRGSFRVAMGQIACTAIPMPIPRGALKAIALWAPIRWSKNFATVPPLRIGTATMATGSFDQDREEAIAAMSAFVQLEQARADHAFFGPMSYSEWMRWGYLHTDHHLRQFGR
jgi:hypothetical protein